MKVRSLAGTRSPGSPGQGRPRSHAPMDSGIAAPGSVATGAQGRVIGCQRPKEPAPAPADVPADRTRPELISEDLQRQFVQEVWQSQQAMLSRQLEDFRSKRLMGMTPWEHELAQLEAWAGRDRLGFEARERHLAEQQLTQLEEMQ